MRWEIIFSVIFIAFALFLLVFYWLIPFNIADFIYKPSNFNFTIGESQQMQFYPNLRFPSSLISYRISDCSSVKEADMEKAFLEISDITVLKFYPVDSDEQIFVTCREDTQREGDLFIAGEGGPTKVIAGDKFNVIFKGKITLLRESGCKNSNIGVHELLHVLGFEHSLNPYNIMYNITNCQQTIGDDIPKLLNQLYSYQSLADLAFRNVSAKLKGAYLDINMTIKNKGLKDSETASVEIYTDDKLLKKFELESLEVGEGVIISFSNIFVPRLSVGNLEILIISDFKELDKENNDIKLEIKKD